MERFDPDPDRPAQPGLFVAVAVLVYVAAALILFFPGLFLAIGVQAIGADAGWWAGDPNANDGEAVSATATGLIAAVIVLPASALVLWATGRRAKVRPALAIIPGTLLLVLGLVGLCVATIAG